ncbi:hypothetical protein ABB37_06703 [Leptomonas pyrrhocoris]|uniref:Transmembrane protein n=1 Tax=Leptomonas pyrrhocoris TaxID=157538 RepID=A0A0M9FX73_LEPPY|nr:hypothetical protein ABB37_06703 [Leptomonas pyrrhocoris]KPA77925.1 hypothetical protein ABB37_06703 [Leptomonas pyrrhocoris]|eukprot:XP_015656364.1 hypothetical protein ABB37_06703 [Leptomonas pyrrhocoris]
MLSVTERLSQVRKRAHEEDAFASVEVVLVNTGAACVHRGEPRKRQSNCPPALLLLVAFTVLLVIVYITGYQPLQSASERTRRLLEAQRRQEEAEFSKQLWADVLRRRLQEQAAIGRPSVGAVAAIGDDEDEWEGEAVGRNNMLAAGASAPQDEAVPDSTTVFSHPSSPISASASTTITTTDLPRPAPPVSSVQGNSTRRRSNSSTSALFQKDDSRLRVPPKGFPSATKDHE